MLIVCGWTPDWAIETSPDPLTLTAPPSDSCSLSRDGDPSALWNVNDQLSPPLRTGELKAPLSATTWWVTVSLLVQVTVSPKLFVRIRGVKPDFVIWTVVVAAPALEAPARLTTTPSSKSSLRMDEPPPICATFPRVTKDL